MNFTSQRDTPPHSQTTMTEYDFSPEGFERYRSTQDRISQWVGSSQQYSSEDPFMSSPSEGGRDYAANRDEHWGLAGHENIHNGRHRQASRGHRHGLATGILMPLPDNQGFGYSGQPGVTALPSTFSPPLSSRNGSANPAMMGLPPQEHSPPPASRGSMHDIQNITTNRGVPYHIPDLSSRSSIQRHPSHPVLIPVSATRSHFRSQSDEWTSSSRSYSSDSYSTNSSQAFPSSQYRTIHPSVYSPTIIQPSRHLPIVVPIQGGVGGYVVIPAVGQDLQVIDPTGGYRRRTDQSLIGRLLSPSKWGLRSKSKRKVFRL